MRQGPGADQCDYSSGRLSIQADLQLGSLSLQVSHRLFYDILICFGWLGDAGCLRMLFQSSLLSRFALQMGGVDENGWYSKNGALVQRSKETKNWQRERFSELLRKLLVWRKERGVDSRGIYPFCLRTRKGGQRTSCLSARHCQMVHLLFGYSSSCSHEAQASATQQAFMDHVPTWKICNRC